MNQCENELICDFAEVYHIYNMHELPLRTAAVLAGGLKSNSRVRLFFSGEEYTMEQTLQVLIYDSLNRLVWLNSADGAKGRRRPQALAEKLFNKKKSKDTNEAFDSAEDFKARWERIQRG